ncbi:hypothetical protein DC094_02045 [Pelagibaculum spongiae]|uniref:Uncharacterized protein n=1 Tax=Pelagibaculum spongiae TaxID=2080658 RepID=A0A2V1H1K1_9GAMM|nr:hypothetical protein DC094_02045 [Pelagibaculum spongiae]
MSAAPSDIVCVFKALLVLQVLLSLSDIVSVVDFVNRSIYKLLLTNSSWLLFFQGGLEKPAN